MLIAENNLHLLCCESVLCNLKSLINIITIIMSPTEGVADPQSVYTCAYVVLVLRHSHLKIGRFGVLKPLESQ